MSFQHIFVVWVYFEGVVCSMCVVTYHTHPNARSDFTAFTALPNIKNPTGKKLIIFFLNVKNIN